MSEPNNKKNCNKNHWNVRRFVALLVAAYVVLTAAFALLGPKSAIPLLPIVRMSLEFLHPEFDVQSIKIHGNKMYLESKVRVEKSGQKGHVIFPVSLEFQANQLLVCPIIALALLFAWPHQSKKSALVTLLLVLPLIALVEAVDAPNSLAAALSEKLAAPQPSPQTLLSFWWFFVDNGGRQLLSLLVVPGAVLLRNRLRWHNVLDSNQHSCTQDDSKRALKDKSIGRKPAKRRHTRTTAPNRSGQNKRSPVNKKSVASNQR